MTAHALTDDSPPSGCPEVWHPQRLASLLADVGEAGLRDLLRLFAADLPGHQSRFAAAVAAGNPHAAAAVLVLIQDSADALGLAALAALARELHTEPLAQAGPGRLAAEAARIRFVPSPKNAS